MKHYFRDRFLVVALEPSLASLDDPVAVSVELSSRLDLPGKIKKQTLFRKSFQKLEKYSYDEALKVPRTSALCHPWNFFFLSPVHPRPRCWSLYYCNI